MRLAQHNVLSCIKDVVNVASTIVWQLRTCADRATSMQQRDGCARTVGGSGRASIDCQMPAARDG
jgi:hypothetical protein